MARREAGAISKCATRDAGAAQGLTSHPFFSGHPRRSTLGAGLCPTGTTIPPARANQGSPRSAALRAPSPPPPLGPATFPRLTERVEVLDSGHTIRFLFLGGNGLRKAAAGEGGRGGRSVGKRGGSRGRQLSPRRRLSDWGGGAAPVFTYIAAPVTPARCPHVSAPPMASNSRAPVRCGFLLVGGRS